MMAKPYMLSLIAGFCVAKQSPVLPAWAVIWWGYALAIAVRRPSLVKRIACSSEGVDCIMSASDSESMSGSEQGSEEVSGNSDESMEEVEGSESEEEEEEIVELKVLPQRGTRGNRMTTLIAEEDSADEEFWQQDFFAEEGKDEEYEKSSEGEDEADTDFSESVRHLLQLCTLKR